MRDFSEPIKRAARELVQARPALAFSGAGMSAESGIPTFRGDDGLWKNHSPALYGNIPGLALAFLLRPAKLAGFFLGVLDAFLETEPNPGHLALAELSQKGLVGPVITQNIDNFHQMAGSPEVIELHGSLSRWRCLSCRRKTTLSRDDFIPLRETLSRPGTKRTALIRLARTQLPRCPNCKGRMRPDVVFFGEGLPQAELGRAMDLAGRCRLMLVLGTSGVVYPAAMIPQVAKRSGAMIIEINPEPTQLTSIADIFIPGPSGEVLPQILGAALKIKENP